MQWLSEQDLSALDDFARGAGGEAGLDFLAPLEGVIALCRAYPRLSHELRALRGEAQRRETFAAQCSTRATHLEAEVQMYRDRVAALERQVRAAAAA